MIIGYNVFKNYALINITKNKIINTLSKNGDTYQLFDEDGKPLEIYIKFEFNSLRYSFIRNSFEFVGIVVYQKDDSDKYQISNNVGFKTTNGVFSKMFQPIDEKNFNEKEKLSKIK